MFDLLGQVMNSFVSGDRAVKQFSSIQGVVIAIANVFIIIAVGLSVVSMAFSFIQFVTSTGDPKLVEKAEQSILWAVIGFVVAFAAYAIKEIIVRMIGVGSY